MKKQVKKIALYGGAFNPVTIGHIQAAQFLSSTLPEFEEVWMMPCYTHMYGKHMASPEHRLAMLKLAIQDARDARLHAFAYEIDNQLESPTVHIIDRLLHDKTYVDIHFSMIIGTDNANTFRSWINGEELAARIPFIVLSRAGVKVDEEVTWYKNTPHIDLTECAPVPAEPISSTEVRHAVRANDEEFLKKAVCGPVLSYVYANHLYKDF